ncbi:hypothetical protein F5X98DRAFT_388821 [Xylaria grammica]|nr:hypothetical protein F5X98DRAFT_388821 [Xylaria grammica]
MSQPLLDHLLDRGVEAWAWFLTAKVPLPALVGPPAVVLAVVLAVDWSPSILHAVLQGAEAAAQFTTQLGLFIAHLPATTVAVATEIFFTTRLLDSPLPLWLADFARGFARGLGRSLLVFSDDLEDWPGNGNAEPQGDGAHTPVGTPPTSPGSAGQSVDGSDGGSDGGGDGDGFLRYEGPDHDRTGATATPIFDELGAWGPFARHALGIISLSGFALLIVFVVCHLVDGDGDGYSEVCGGPNGEGEYACLWNNDDAIREAAAVGLKPLKYRFFYDGTRMQFPDR